MSSGPQTLPPQGAAASSAAARRNSVLALVLLGVFTFVWLAWSMAANFDAADGRRVLFMDELVTYDGISDIREAKTAAALGDAISGPDQRYGRTTWYLPAIFAAPFGELMGESGQIVATRIFFAVALMTSFFVFTLALIDSWSWRAMAIVSAAVTPYAAYYATMPKPEPLLLLFLSVYFYLMVRRGQNLGWSWVFLGLAFGAKISTAVALPLILVLAVLREWAMGRIRSRGPIHFGFALAGSLLAFLVGFVATVPAVLTASGFQLYLNSTWRNTGHGGSDSSAIGPGDWLRFVADTGFFGPGGLAFLALSLMMVLTAAGLLLAFTGAQGSGFADRLRQAGKDRRIVGAAVFAVGLVLTASIVVGVKRVWGFYLLPGAVMMIFGAFSVVETLAHKPTNLFLRAPARVVGVLLFLLAFIGGGAGTAMAFRHEARRSEDPSFKLQQARYDLFTGMAEKQQAKLGRPTKVLYRAGFWTPTNSDQIRYYPLYGVRDIWVESYDLVFLQKEDDPAIIGDPSMPYAKEVAQFLAQREEHLAAAPGQHCKTEPCYVAVPLDLPGIYAWELAADAQAQPAAPGAASTEAPASGSGN